MANKKYKLKFNLDDGKEIDAGIIEVPQGDKGDKGDQGQKGDTGATPVISATATVNAEVGTPSVEVTKGGTAETPSLAFAFKNMKGEQGEKGLKGDKGETGAKGDKGDPFTIAKTYTSVAAMNAGYATDGVAVGSFVLIDTGNVEDEDNAKLYVKGASAYTYLTDLSGAQGIKGDKGAKGDTGATGATFTPFVSSEGVISWSNDGGKANPANVNIKGVKGDKGDKGETGARGNTIFSGSGDAPNDLGVVGDFFISIDADGKETKLYKKTAANSWDAQTYLNGEDGTDILVGSGAPSTDESFGKKGDSYINTTTFDMYKNEGGGHWAKIGNIKGAKGDQGAKGDTGAQGVSVKGATLTLVE